MDSKVAEWRKLIKSLRDAGVEPYPHNFKVTHTVKALNELRRQALLDPWVGASITTAGRATDVRRHPNVVFIDVYEDGARFQVMVDPREPLLEYIWRGDYVGVSGVLTKTQRGDYAVRAERLYPVSYTHLTLPTILRV